MLNCQATIAIWCRLVYCIGMWNLTDNDGYSAFIRDDEKKVVANVKTYTDEEKANTRRILVAPEAVALVEMIANQAGTAAEWLAIARRIIWRKDSEQL